MITIEPNFTGTIHTWIVKAIGIAAEEKSLVTFDFNGVTVIVAGDSDPALVYRDWDRGLMGYTGKHPVAGPYPKPELSAEELASDAAIRAEKDKRSAERQAQYAEEARAKALMLQEALSAARPIALSDPEKWQKFVAANSDGYGGRIVRYAEEWARLMQTRMDNGESLADCAEDLSHLADDDGITGFMYGAAVSVLSQCWAYGENLRRWHNKETQIGTEGDAANENGGVLNPALLSRG